MKCALPALIVLASFAGAVTESAAETVTLTGRAMGTSWSVKFRQPDLPLDQEAVFHEVAARLEELEQIFSTHRPQSHLSHFNAQAVTDWVPVPAEMAQVAAESQRLSVLTRGAYDVTVLPLIDLWGFGARSRAGSIPAAADIAAARQLVDWRQLEVRLNPPALRKAAPHVAADFSSMSKGFAVDAISRHLAALGAPDHLVQVGGDVRAGGAGAGRTGWAIAIEQPLEDDRGIACVLSLAELAVSTSGDYRNFFHVGRQRYGHIIDPRTGQPPRGELASVSVVHASCMLSSSLATALFVLGAEEGMRLAREQDLACLFLVRRGTTLVRLATPEFERLLQ